MPSERPRCAMFTRPETNSGSSRASEANSSMTISSRGSVGSSGSATAGGLVVLQVLDTGIGEHPLTTGQLGAEGFQRPGHQLRVEVGDHPDGVRQAFALTERAAALVVDEHERHRVGPIGHRERGDQ